MDVTRQEVVVNLRTLIFAAVTLSGVLTPAYAIDEETCKETIRVYEVIMDARLDGITEDRALELTEGYKIRGRYPGIILIVGTVYALPRSKLTGSERADWLSEEWEHCMSYETGSAEAKRD